MGNFVAPIGGETSSREKRGTSRYGLMKLLNG